METAEWELVVYRFEDGNVLSGVDAEDVHPVLAVELPGTARAWTPALGQCLEPGARYAWSVRATGKDGANVWSDPRLFRVTAAPTLAEVRDAMAIMSAYLGVESLEIRTDPGQGETAVRERPVADFEEPAAAPEGVTPTLGGSAAIRGVQNAVSGDASGVIGESSSPDGAGGVFGNTAGGPDVVLDGSADTETDTLISQGGIDRSSDAPETFDFGNTGSGEMTLTVDGVDVVTTDTDADTLGGLSCGDGQLAKWNIGTTQWECAVDADTLFTAGNQLSLDVTQFNVLEGSGSGLDADTLDGLDSTDFLGSGVDNWVNVTGDTMTGTLTLNPASGNALSTNSDIEMGNGAIRRGGMLFLHRPGGFNTAVGLRALESNSVGAFAITAIGEMALRSNTTGLYNTAVGTEALEDNIEGNHNTAVGRGALRANVAHINTAVGSAALRFNTTGAANTAVGRSSLLTNTTGSSNSAVGEGALAFNTTGSYNTAVGQVSLLRNTTGHRNVAVGGVALKINETGYRNVAVGIDAMQQNVSGNKNVAVGNEALFKNEADGNTAIGSWSMKETTTGTYNTAVGEASLWFNTTGTGNTALGVQAMQSNTEGGNNAAVGRAALLHNTTGHKNVALGFGALRSNTGIAVHRNVAVGYRAQFLNEANGITAVGYMSMYANNTGNNNSALGEAALKDNLTGSSNTATGSSALKSNTTGAGNSAVGSFALYSNIAGSHNTALGFRALYSSETTSYNSAFGSYAMYANTTGYYNAAFGSYALRNNATGTDNLALGHWAGINTTGSSNVLLNHYGVAAENNTLRIGKGTGTGYKELDAAFVHGIFGKTSTGGSTVLINSDGKLGTITSSRRFKERIRGIDGFSDDLLALRPVQFRFTEELAGADPPLEFGLIAEEVAEVFPDLVIYDDEGDPYTVRYHLLAPLLLNEIQRQQKVIATMNRRLEFLEGNPVDGR